MRGDKFRKDQLGDFAKPLRVHLKVWNKIGVEDCKANQAGNITNSNWRWPSSQELMLVHDMMITVLADINTNELHSG